MKIWPFRKRQTREHQLIRWPTSASVEAVDDKTLADCRARFDIITPFTGAPSFPRPRPDHLTRFPPGRSGNPRGRRRGIGNDMLEARHIAAEMYRGLGMAGLVDDTEHGRRDDKPEMMALVAAVRRGRVLGARDRAKGEAK